MALQEGLDAYGNDNSDSGSGSATGNGQNQDAEQSELPDKYQGKSAEEIAEMHQNAQKKIHQQSNEISELRGQVNEISRRLDSEAEEQGRQAPTREELIQEVTEELPDDSYDMEPEQLVSSITKVVDEMQKQRLEQFEKERVRPIQDQAVREQANSIIDRVASRHDDFDQYTDDIREIVGMPAMATAIEQASPQEKEQLLENAYKMARADNLPSNGQSADSSKGSVTNGSSSRRVPSANDEQVKEKIVERVTESMGL